MKRYTKLAVVTASAALMSLGLSSMAFAASNGTWKVVDGDWYCYNSSGDVYTDTFCNSNGKEYYVGDDGRLVRSDWVEYDGDYYFVNSAGQKITNDWRMTSPYWDEDGDEQWYYFQATGKMAYDKKLTYKGSTYYFDGEGTMLTGWVSDSDGTIQSADSAEPDETYFCDETGARIQSGWVVSTEPGTDEDDADADEYWYYLKSSGKLATGKQTNIKGQMYFFDGEGRMLSGWVAYDGDSYFEIDGEDSDAELRADAYTAVYYCGGEDDGHAKKNKWMKLWRPADTYEEDSDVDSYWYWIAADGKIYIPSDADAEADRYTLGDGEMEFQSTTTATKKKINSKEYFFNANGEMLSDFVKMTASNANIASGLYYFGDEDDGSMKTGSQSVKDDNDETYKFYFGTKAVSSTGEAKGVGITGNKSGKLYFNGLLIRADDYKYQTATIDGHTFIVNQNGSIQHSQVEYKEDGDILIDTSTEKAGDTVVYQISYTNSNDQWEDSIDENASIGTLRDYTDPIDIYSVMNVQ